MLKDETFYYVAYTRVSSDEQRDGISIDYQLDKIQQWVSKQSGIWVCIGEFQEDFTGFSYERPEMDSIWKLAKQKKINAIVVMRRNRFARGEAASMILEQHFKTHNVRLFSVEQGEFSIGATNRILSAVERAQSEDEAQSNLRNMREKRYAYVESGVFQSQGKPKYGYNKSGKKGNTQLTVNEDEADVIRLVMQLFIQRKNYNEIADILNNEGIPRKAISKGLNRSSLNDGWNKASVRSIIMDARYYKGEFIAYRRAMRKDDHAGKEVIINVPAIIDEATYQRVVYMRDSLRKIPIYTDYDPFTLAKRMTCECGYAYAQQKTMRKSKSTGKDTQLYRYYKCLSTDDRYNRRNVHCSIRTLHGDKVEAVVYDFIKDLMNNPKAAIARYKQEQQQQSQMLDNAIAHIESIDELIVELEAEKEQVITLFKKRLIKDDRAESDILTIDRQIDKLNIERSKWVQVLADNELQDSHIQDLESIALAIHDKLDSYTAHDIIGLYDRLKLKIHVATEDGMVVLIVSILGTTTEKLTFRDNTSSACCESIINNNPLTFRLAFRAV